MSGWRNRSFSQDKTGGWAGERMERYCTSCNIWRPPRAHHCNVCGFCMDHFDHHCSIIGTCVAKLNHRWFTLFLLFALVADIILTTGGYVMMKRAGFPGASASDKQCLISGILVSFIPKKSFFCWDFTQSKCSAYSVPRYWQWTSQMYSMSNPGPGLLSTYCIEAQSLQDSR